MLTAAGEVVLRRRYFWGRGCGGRYPSDDQAGIGGSAVSAGARELCCVMGLSSDFRAAALNLKRVGGVGVSAERLRQVVEREAAAVAAGRDAGLVPAAWSARADALERGRLYVGADGLMVRAVTQAEKDKRRKAHAARRRLRRTAGTGNLRPLPAVRPGADQAFKEVKFGVFYDQPKDRRHLLATAGDGAELGRLLRLGRRGGWSGHGGGSGATRRTPLHGWGARSDWALSSDRFYGRSLSVPRSIALCPTTLRKSFGSKRRPTGEPLETRSSGPRPGSAPPVAAIGWRNGPRKSSASSTSWTGSTKCGSASVCRVRWNSSTTSGGGSTAKHSPKQDYWLRATHRRPSPRAWHGPQPARRLSPPWTT